ncbi:MAG: 50S ribosomal protein L25, partial [Duncaniella sp.]|nr:50S ribosomal protein L25 [Duncaniella sp.]
MKTFKLTAQPRTDLGKKAAKELRKSNLIPVVLNGDGKEAIHLTVSQEDVRKLVYTPEIFAIELTVEGNTSMA